MINELIVTGIFLSLLIYNLRGIRIERTVKNGKYNKVVTFSIKSKLIKFANVNIKPVAYSGNGNGKYIQRKLNSVKEYNN